MKYKRVHWLSLINTWNTTCMTGKQRWPRHIVEWRQHITLIYVYYILQFDWITHVCSPSDISWIHVNRYLVQCDFYTDLCLSSRFSFSINHCVVCTSSVYGWWLSLWYRHTLLVSLQEWLLCLFAITVLWVSACSINLLFRTPNQLKTMHCALYDESILYVNFT